ncbi:ABC transporter permease [Paenibacillus sp. HJL G12]|uniref:ABC transporter permease n=1 Tax=Paenibacillus dendrobii TaxID=2691084 RepID=A0A7X3IL90_9BACL|nr:ABC transporter permease [Paenibacillus dendrobii]MWV46017.1 ABC transporter permease [Paenibacillus dendrobii]
MAAAWLLIIPLLSGISHLDPAASAVVLEKFTALTGIILMTPLFLPEQNRDIRDLMDSKATPQTGVQYIRLLLASLTIVVMVWGMVTVMQAMDSHFPAARYIFGTFASAFFLGSIGFAAYGLCNQLAIGYMVPLAYYLTNMFTGSKYVQYFYLFSLGNGSFDEKYWLFAGGVILIVLTLAFKEIQRRR